MVPGQVYPVSVTMQNTGNTTWRTADGYMLNSQNPQGNTTWGLSLVQLPNDVAPGQNVTFSFNVTAPSTAGVYNFQWKMLRNNVQWFGTSSANVEVAVGSVNNAAFVSQSVPGTMMSNQSYAVSVTMRNNGSNPWTVGDYYLRSQNPEDNSKWNLNRVELPNAVAPGDSVTFNFSVMPTLNGYTNFQWRMAQGATSFGALTTNVNVGVNGSNNAAFVSQSVPEVMVPGQVYPVSVTMQNTGTTTWRTADGFSLHSQNPLGNTNWGLTQVALPNDVSPGQNVTFSFNATAPSTPGVYNFQWRMLRHNVHWFGALSTNVEVAVNGTNDSQFVSQTVPGTMSPGQSYPVSVTLQNTGTSTWATGNYFLGSENPEANTTWGLNRVDLTAPVASGASVTLNFNVTSPSTAGMYNFQWRMVQNSTRFGAFTTNVSVNIQQAQAMALYYVHTDHLNTPRLVADATGTTVWRWDQAEPFGSNPANEDPDANLVAFDLPLRLPGQRYDSETGLAYNMARDYASDTGRYIQSDPIGLAGGINTYSYVGSGPLKFADPLGLQAIPMPPLTPPVVGPNSGSSSNIARALNNLWKKIKEMCTPRGKCRLYDAVWDINPEDLYIDPISPKPVSVGGVIKCFYHCDSGDHRVRQWPAPPGFRMTRQQTMEWCPQEFDE